MKPSFISSLSINIYIFITYSFLSFLLLNVTRDMFMFYTLVLFIILTVFHVFILIGFGLLNITRKETSYLAKKFFISSSVILVCGFGVLVFLFYYMLRGF